MFLRNALNMLVAITIILPTMFSGHGIAHAEKFMSRQNIVDGLKKRNRTNKAHRQVRRDQRRVSKKRAPQSHNRRRNPQGFRAPPRVVRSRPPQRDNHVILHSRPPARDGRLNRRRAPERDSRVVRRRAPLRAPRPDNGHLKSRVPQPDRNVVAKRRAPNRNPQHFNNQVASTSGTINGRGIRFEEQGSAYPDGASVDLEILFEYDSARISPKSVRQLITLGEALQDASLNGSRIMIAGHTDAAGGNAYNENLSFRRAQSVSDFLANYAGISPNRLAIEGYGEEYLKYPDAPNSGQNRRVEIINLGG
ncbi:MAG: OmpA family protein [Rhizobiaceae bacterium]|nr:OmpA family protein [Rhizobiaceae bacterium]